jgi:ribosomal protein S18 acetylase RimI-like enzyme
MALNWTISEVRPSDADAIASLFASSWTSTFSRLQFGHVESQTLAVAMTPRIARQMTEPNSLFLVARQTETDEVLSIAQWTVPADEPQQAQESLADMEERQRFEDEIYYNSLPESSSKDLIMEFTAGLRNLRQSVLQGRRHFLLENLATHPDYRGKGLAAQLIKSTLQQADEQNMLVYLDTASDNKAMGLYKKLGFEEEGRHTIEDLSRFVGKAELESIGAENEHTHVAFVRYPQPAW